MKKLTSFFLGLCLLTALCIEIVQAQTTTYTHETKYRLRKAYNLKHNHGISAYHTTGWTKITVEVKTANPFNFGGSAGQVIMYRAYITPSDVGVVPALKHHGTPEDYWTRNFLNNNNWSTKTADSDSRTFFRAQALAVDIKVPGSSWKKWGEDNIDVVVTVTIEGGGNLRDIVEIKLPGSDPLDGGHFVDYTNPCDANPSFPGCDAVADFKNVSNAANKKAIVIAHRGYHGMRGEFPENSKAAVQKAYDEDFRYIEVDLRMTKDNVPFLFHDDWLGYVTDFPYRDNNAIASVTEDRTWGEIDNYKYRNRYWDQGYETASNATNQYVRLGEVTNEKLNTFSEACDYISGKDIMLYLDIKSVPTNRNMEVMKQCLFIAAEKNVLHQIAVKMIRTNNGAPPDKQLVMPVNVAETQLGGIYRTLKDDLNVHIVDYAPNEGTTFITDWIAEGNVVGFEFDAANTDGMLKAPAFNSKTFPGSLSVWEYTKSQGYRTGVWSSAPVDPRGRPGHDPSKWSTGNAMKLTDGSDTYFRYKDSRSRLEIQMMVTPQYITHDRPDTWVSYLNAIGLYNTNTKK